MKYLLKTAGIFFVFIAHQAIAQDSMRKNIISINPLSLFYTNVSIFYEHALAHNLSVKVGLNYMFDVSTSTFFINQYSSSDIPTRVLTQMEGPGFTPELRYYFKKDSASFHTGPYVGVWYRLRMLNAVENDENDSAHLTIVNTYNYKLVQNMAGVLAGYQFIFKKHFAVDVFGGPYYNINSVTYVSGDDAKHVLTPGILGGTGLGFRLGAGIGYLF